MIIGIITSDNYRVKRMRIALINTIKPHAGSGDGITEYTYQIYDKLRGGNEVDLVYGLDASNRNDVKGNLIIHSLFKSKIRKLAKQDYDIIHITNQELGFAAKILRQAGSKAKIVTSIHDLMRLDEHEKRDFHKGLMQSTFNYLVSSSIREAVEYSDMIIFTASTVQKDSQKRFKPKDWRTTLLCPKESFRTASIPAKKRGGEFRSGWVGALSFRKNVIFVLKTALLMKGDSRFKFVIWGSGAEKQNLLDFKKEHGLDNVSFMGFAPEKELMDIYDGFDLFFYPSLEEGSSLPILDAQARGLPVIVFKGNHIDVEVTKYCMPAKDPEEAAAMIRKIADEGYPAELREELTRYARSFSWDRVADETFEIYRKITQDR